MSQPNQHSTLFTVSDRIAAVVTELNDLSSYLLNDEITLVDFDHDCNLDIVFATKTGVVPVLAPGNWNNPNKDLQFEDVRTVVEIGFLVGRAGDVRYRAVSAVRLLEVAHHAGEVGAFHHRVIHRLGFADGKCVAVQA